MSSVPLGPRPVVAAADTTGRNTGNYTAVFDGQIMGIQNPVFEMYHLFLTAPALSGQSTIADVALNGYFWDTTLIGQRNSWDPSQPLLMTPGDTLYIFFNFPTSNATKPTATAWFRYSNI